VAERTTATGLDLAWGVAGTGVGADADADATTKDATAAAAVDVDGSAGHTETRTARIAAVGAARIGSTPGAGTGTNNQEAGVVRRDTTNSATNTVGAYVDAMAT
jgi:hypothetical protein